MMIIKARIEGGVEDVAPIRLAEFERYDGQLKQLGLSLAEDKSLLHEVQHRCRSIATAQHVKSVLLLISGQLKEVAKTCIYPVVDLRQIASQRLSKDCKVKKSGICLHLDVPLIVR
ncbi:MAG: hypothetical protein CFE43_21150 [Burkholderiales bacterium PBB3]|nr:MAG: hypothetical protein CFE43_21150 [Burkholderiales bacterium PBB3]